MVDREKVLCGLDRCSKCLYPSVFDQQFKDCEYTMGMYCRKDKLISETVELLKEQEEIINDLKKIIPLLNQHIKDLSEYMTPYGMVKDVKAYVELLKEQDAVVRCKDCRYGQFCTDGGTTYQCFKWNSNEFGALHEQDWFCADGRR